MKLAFALILIIPSVVHAITVNTVRVGDAGNAG